MFDKQARFFEARRRSRGLNRAEGISPLGFSPFSVPQQSHTQLSGEKEKKEKIMNPLIQSKITVVSLVIALALAGFALSPGAQAVSPAPDGAYPGGNTAEGGTALFSLTTGQHNTAVGLGALYSDTSGGRNTANGVG